MPGLTPTQVDTLAMMLHQPLVVVGDDLAYFFDTSAQVRVATFRRLRDLALVEQVPDDDGFWRPSGAGRELLRDHGDRVAAMGRAHAQAVGKLELARLLSRAAAKRSSSAS